MARFFVYLCAAVVLVSAGMLIGFLARGDQQFTDWLYRWQTLVTGLAAVSAASATVAAMIWTDQRHQLRHQDVIDLARRPDRLLIERCAVRTFAMREMAKALRERAAKDNIEWQSIRHDLEAYLPIDILDEGRRLYGPQMVFRFDMLKKHRMVALRAIDELQSLSQGAGGNAASASHLLRTASGTLAGLIEAFADDLESLAGEFR